MMRQELSRHGIVLERPSPTEEDPRCKVCGQPLSNWRPGMPLLCRDHNPNRRRPVPEGQENESVLFEEWLQGTLWSVAAP